MGWQQKLVEYEALANEVAAAKARLASLEHARKAVLAEAMVQSGEKTAAAQEREAYRSETYQVWLEGFGEATHDYEAKRLRLRALETWFECARTQESSKREEMRLAR